MLELSFDRCGGSGVVYYHIGQLSFSFQRFLRGLTTGKIVLRPTALRCSPPAHRPRGIDKNNSITKSVPARLQHQRYIEHNCCHGVLLSQVDHPLPDDLANFRMRQLFQIFQFSGTTGAVRNNPA